MSTTFLIRHGLPDGDAGIGSVGRQQACAAARAVLVACSREAQGREAAQKHIILHSSPTSRARATSAAFRDAFAEDPVCLLSDVVIEEVLNLPDTRADAVRMFDMLRGFIADEANVHVCVTHEPNVVIAAREFALPIRQIECGGVVRISAPTNGESPIATLLPP